MCRTPILRYPRTVREAVKPSCLACLRRLGCQPGWGGPGSVPLSPPCRKTWEALGQDAVVWLPGRGSRRQQAGVRLGRGVLGRTGAGGRGCCLRLVRNWCLPRGGSCGGAAHLGSRQVRGRPVQPPRDLGVSSYWLFGGPLVVVLVPVPSGGWVVVAGFRAQLSRCEWPGARWARPPSGFALVVAAPSI